MGNPTYLMLASSFVNSHITENITEYQKYCRDLYSGRHLWEDLFHDFYAYLATVPEDKLRTYNETPGKLRCVCFLIIKRMYLRRGRTKSTLNEVCNLYDVDFDLRRNVEVDNRETPQSRVESYHLEKLYDRQLEEIEHATEHSNKLDLLFEMVRKKLTSEKDWYNTTVLLTKHGITMKVDKNTGELSLVKTPNGPQSISKIARDARLNRDQLGQACKRAQLEIRRYVEQPGDK